jgi:hypothetical protein
VRPEQHETWSCDREEDGLVESATKGWWLWGSVIGFAIGILTASWIARWPVILLVALGCLFAIAFRLTRNGDEI